MKYAVTGILLLSVALALHSVFGRAATFDEPLHLASGYSYWAFNDYRMQPENGVLPQRLAGLPLCFMDLKLSAPESWTSGNQWWFCRAIFLASGAEPGRVLLAARTACLLSHVGMCLTVLGFSWELWGKRAALFSFALAALCPNLLAHGPLATSDAAASWLFLLTLWMFWRVLEGPGRRNAALFGVALGLLFGAKMSALLVFPALGVALLAHPQRPPASMLWRAAALSLTLALVVLWALYGFRFSAIRDSSDYVHGARLGGGTPDLVPFVPEAYQYGFAFVLRYAKARRAYFEGRWSDQGFRDFFPKLFLWKGTPALLVLIPVAVPSWRKRAVWPLLAFLAVYGGTSMLGHLNIGHRHILPLYPVLYVLVGSVAARWPRFAAACVIAQAASTLSTHPHYLAYFNVTAGNPDRVYRRVVESSLDWGQDLGALAEWAAHNRLEYLSYFGSDDPRRFGLNPTQLPSFLGWGGDPLGTDEPLRPGWYALSATSLMTLYTPDFWGPWTPALEEQYLRIPGHRAETDSRVFRQLRFMRLCAILRERPPDVVLNHTILLWNLTAADLEKVR